MKNVDWSTVNDSKLEPGGYVCRIVEVEDNPEKEYLFIKFDIAAGSMQGYYAEKAIQYENWPKGGTFYRSYKDSALRFFKGFVTALEQSNTGFRWTSAVNADPSKIAGLLFGATIGAEEYISNGQLKESLKLRDVYSVASIEDGRFRFPEKKWLPKGNPASQFSVLEEDDGPLPWDN